MSEFSIITQFDEPRGEIEYLGIKKTFETLSKFLISPSVSTPLSVAIHGEWGSGKTNLLKALQNNLNNDKTHVIFFEAWKYESSSPNVALITTIANELAENADIGRNLVQVSVDAFIRKNLDMSLENLSNTLRSGFDSTANLSNILSSGISKKLRNRRLIILIDDLDRCDVENTLSILSMMKLFLDIPNCMCVAAVDFNRLEQAWFSKYGITDESNSSYRKEGRQYLEKIFQVRVSIPHSSLEERKNFLEKLAMNMPRNLLDLISEIGPVNPRGIKRMINLASYRTFLIENTHASTVSLLWTLLEEIVSSKSACKIYEILETKTGFVNELFINPGTWPTMQAHLNVSPTLFEKTNSLDKFKKFFESCKAVFTGTVGSGEWNDKFATLYQSSKELQS